MADPRSQNLQRNPEYYLMGGDAHFLVGNQQFFRIHKYFFDRESSHWHNFFAKNPRAGTDESTAIVLDNIHPRDFAAFCWVFYNPVYWLYEATQDQWIAILGLAHEWAFETVKQLAVRELAQLDIELIERINVYQTYEVDEEIIFPYYIELCERDEPLTFQESQLLGPRTFFVIHAARERLRAANIDEDGRTSIVEGRDVESTLKDLLEGVPRPEVDNMRESGRLARLRRRLGAGPGVDPLRARTGSPVVTKLRSSMATHHRASESVQASILASTSTPVTEASTETGSRLKVRWTGTPPLIEEPDWEDGSIEGGSRSSALHVRQEVDRLSVDEQEETGEVKQRASSLRRRISLAWKEVKDKRKRGSV